MVGIPLDMYGMWHVEFRCSAGNIRHVAVNRLTVCQCASSPGTITYSHAELAVSSTAVAEITITHHVDPQSNGQAELAWVISRILRWWLACRKMISHPSTDRAWHRGASLIVTNTLPLSNTDRDGHSFNGTTWVSRHQKDRTILDFTEARVPLSSPGPYANHLHLTPDR